MNRTKSSVSILSLLSLALLFTLSCSGAKETKQTSPEIVRDVQLVTIQRSTLPSYYEAMGTVRPVHSAQVSAQTTGNIIRIAAREGDRVKQGQVLAVIDDTQNRAALDRALAGQRASVQEITAANSEFVLAESTLKRYQLLQEKHSVSPHEFEQVKAQYEAAKARREMSQAANAGADAAVVQARTSQGYTIVRAPFAGVVTAKLAEVGSLASPGIPLFSVEDSTSFRLEVDVDESNIGTVHLGSTVPVSIDAVGGTVLQGKVAQILPAADANSRSFLVKLELPKHPSVRAGLFGRAQFPIGTREGLAVPNTAVVRRGSMQAVFAVTSDQVASLRYITLGAPSENRFEVLSGLENGDRIVANPGDRELNGKKIEVR